MILTILDFSFGILGYLFAPRIQKLLDQKQSTTKITNPHTPEPTRDTSPTYLSCVTGITPDTMGGAVFTNKPEAHLPESRVLVIMTGGTICMQPSEDGLIPMNGFLEHAMAPRPSFNDHSGPSGIYHRADRIHSPHLTEIPTTGLPKLLTMPPLPHNSQDHSLQKRHQTLPRQPAHPPERLLPPHPLRHPRVLPLARLELHLVHGLDRDRADHLGELPHL